MANERHEVALRLTEERARVGLSQAELAKRAGVTREGLRLYENGQRGISSDFLIACDDLGLDILYIQVGRRDSTKAQEPLAVSINNNGSGNVVGQVNSGGNVTQINTQRHITRTIAEVKPNDAHISEAQAADLKQLVEEVVKAEAKLKATPRTHRSVFAAMNAHCGVTAYRLIALEDFEKARKFLQQWMGRLMSMKSAPVKVGDTWRKRHYAYIKINSKNPDDALALDAYMKKNFNCTSLTELDNEQLDQAYRYIAGRRSKR